MKRNESGIRFGIYQVVSFGVELIDFPDDLVYQHVKGGLVARVWRSAPLDKIDFVKNRIFQSNCRILVVPKSQCSRMPILSQKC